MTLQIRDSADCQYDVVSLGEVMLRFDPGESRIRTAREFRVWEGGGEYNVSRGLRRTFGLRAGVITALVDNEVGRLVEDFILTGGVDTSLIIWKDFDGLGRQSRNGINFTERGFGVRGAVGVADRGHTAVSQMQPTDIDFDHIFGDLGVRWLHTGGIYTGLSDASAEVTLAAVQAAQRHGTIVSYDLNYRPSLWEEFGGQERAQEVNRAIAHHVDVMIGNEEDFTASLGFEIPGVDEELTSLDVGGFRKMMTDVSATYPNLRVIGATMRAVHTASSNDWGAVAWSKDEGFVEATNRERLEIMDRVGGGDSFASGLIYCLMAGEELATAVEFGAAHGALAMTTPGDTSMATKAEVANLAAGGSLRIAR